MIVMPKKADTARVSMHRAMMSMKGVSFRFSQLDLTTWYAMTVASIEAGLLASWLLCCVILSLGFFSMACGAYHVGGSCFEEMSPAAMVKRKPASHQSQETGIKRGMYFARQNFLERRVIRRRIIEIKCEQW